MKGRNVVWTLLLILALLLLAVVRRWREPSTKEALHRTAPLSYTAFALCLLQCNRIDKKSIEELLQKGIIHFNRSNRRRWPCPTFVVQARLQNERYLRVVFEQCNNKTTVLALDDLAQQKQCNCSDEK